MRPALDSPSRAASFGVVLACFLLLPMILYWAGPVPKEQVYRAIPEKAAPANYFRRQIFEDRSDLDVLFVGSSLLEAGTDIPYVRQEMSRALGRPAGVKMLPQVWEGLDMVYLETRDLLEHRRVKMLVFATLRAHRFSSGDVPHVQLFRLARWGDSPGAFAGLSLRLQLAVYADMVLGAPRQALSRLRPNLADETPDLWDTEVNLEGNNGAPFVRHDGPVNAIPPEQREYQPENAGRFRFNEAALGQYQAHFLRKIADLAREHGATLVLLHVPVPPERGSGFVPEHQDIPSVLGDRVRLVGVPFDELFARVPPGEVDDYFRDDHFNNNGQRLFTQTMTPTLIQIYERDAHH